MSMNRPFRVGVIAEGKTELGKSIVDISSQSGGKQIPRSREGALHILIRRELQEVGLGECEFVQLHPPLEHSGVWQAHTGHNILDVSYIKRVVIDWGPQDNVDMVVICVDADGKLAEREIRLQQAIATAREFHFNGRFEQIPETKVGALAIQTIETWLIADKQGWFALLNWPLPDNLPEDLETLPGGRRDKNSAKAILDEGVRHSKYLFGTLLEQRKYEVRWQLALIIDLISVQKRCPQGYKKFAIDLQQAANAVTVSYE